MLSRWQLVAYGLPGLPLAILLLPLFVTVPTFYADDLGLGFATVGAVLFFARIWDVVTDPMIGALSDRTRSRFGRRRPWLALGAPILMAGAWVLFRPPLDVGWVYLLAATLLLYLGGTMIMLPYTAWAAELSAHHHERSRIAAAREAAIIAGTASAIAIPASIGLDRASAMDATAILLIVLVPLSVFIAVTCLPDPQSRPVRPRRWTLAFAQLRQNRPFRQLISAYFVNGIAYGLPATLFLLYVEHVLRKPDWAWGLLIIYFASAMLALPIWLVISRRVGKRATWIAAMALAATAFWPAAFLGSGDVGWFIAICVFTGIPLGAELVMPPSMQADVVDFDTEQTGDKRAGTFFGLWGVATKIPLAIAVGIAFPVLEFIGFTGSGGQNSASSVFVLAALYGFLPVPFKIVAIGLVWRYELDKRAHDRIAQDQGLPGLG
ncbi:MAG: MFS transporter [Alphaproteobacteria bacterium]|nr:MFS transporter [Alphaproteobacteria bacterium]